MNWRNEVMFKLDAAISEMAEMRSWMSSKDVDGEHLLNGHRKTIERLAIQGLPMAYALDQSDLLVKYQGKIARTGACSITRMNRLFGNIRDQIIGLAKSHGQLSGKRIRWRDDADLLVTACAPDLTFGFRLPELQAANQDETPKMIDPVVTALRDSVELMATVTASLQEDDPQVRLQGFAQRHGADVDDYFIDTGLIAARKLIPKQEKRIESVEIAGRAVGAGESLRLDRESWERANRILREKHIPHDRIEATGYLMAVDYEVLRFSLRQLDGWKRKEIRCNYGTQHEEFVKAHGKRKIRVAGTAHFDRDGEPHLIMVEDISEA